MKSQKQTENQKQIPSPPRPNTSNFWVNIWRFINTLGQALTGELWEDVYSTIQDTIAFSILLIVPGIIAKAIIGEDYSGFDQCLETWNIWNVNRYACFTIIAANFSFWIVMVGRIIFRLIKNIRKLFEKSNF